MSSQEETSPTSGDNPSGEMANGGEIEPPVEENPAVPGVNQPDLQAGAIPTPPPSPQPCSSRSVSGQESAMALVYKLLCDFGDFNYALKRQIDIFLRNSEKTKDGCFEGIPPFELVTPEMVKEQEEWRKAGNWHGRDLEEEREEEMATSENEENAGSEENNVVGEDVSTNESNSQDPSPSNANEESGQGN